jgi:hypothetical protein
MTEREISRLQFGISAAAGAGYRSGPLLVDAVGGMPAGPKDSSTIGSGVAESGLDNRLRRRY